MLERTVIKLGNLIDFLREDLANYKHPVWYRGHSDKDWTLVPGIHRLKEIIPETVLINRFKQSANLLVDRRPASEFDWLFIMQHYGVPTRLLDWTESPLVALYFAVFEQKDRDGALWILKPIELNKLTSEVRPEAEFIPSFDDDSELSNYSTQSVDHGRLRGVLPLAALATRNNERVQAQLGVFTISHKDSTPIEQIGSRDHVIKYVIPTTAKSNLQEELRILAFSRFQVFPELASIGQNLKDGLK